MDVAQWVFTIWHILCVGYFDFLKIFKMFLLQAKTKCCLHDVELFFGFIKSALLEFFFYKNRKEYGK